MLTLFETPPKKERPSEKEKNIVLIIAGELVGLFNQRLLVKLRWSVLFLFFPFLGCFILLNQLRWSLHVKLRWSVLIPFYCLGCLILLSQLRWTLSYIKIMIIHKSKELRQTFIQEKHFDRYLKACWVSCPDFEKHMGRVTGVGTVTFSRLFARTKQHVPAKLLESKTNLSKTAAVSAVIKHLKDSPECIQPTPLSQVHVLAQARTKSHLDVIEALFI